MSQKKSWWQMVEFHRTHCARYSAHRGMHFIERWRWWRWIGHDKTPVLCTSVWLCTCCSGDEKNRSSCLWCFIVGNVSIHSRGISAFILRAGARWWPAGHTNEQHCRWRRVDDQFTGRGDESVGVAGKTYVTSQLVHCAAVSWQCMCS